MKTKTEKLDPKFKKKWVAALRSGKYKQTQGALRKAFGPGESGGYCCLGVACDLINPKGWGNQDYGASGINYTPLDSLGRKNPKLDLRASSSLMPESLQKKIGLSFEAMEELAHMNDSGGCSFKVIATHIEKKL